MATALKTLTLAEFDSQYGQEKPYYEFWHGEAVQKSMPTLIHGLLQRILMELLSLAGYESASEVRLKLSSNFQPIPDVVGMAERIELPYPTKPFEVVIEVLSEDDRMSRGLAKCRSYQEWGIQQIYIVVPLARVVLRWHEHKLEEVDAIAHQQAASVWTKLDRATRR